MVVQLLFAGCSEENYSTFRGIGGNADIVKFFRLKLAKAWIWLVFGDLRLFFSLEVSFGVGWRM
ncbi:hypothetical protein J41TS12_31460 [Paenibacillus antibioticophila]|uniref:Uncharacterized protein n=2 Tax=Paenibacillus TaxID=44249 RepID=A0A919XYT5_9BACL|nr:hypothetical protein J41TS12_31460 [Paenibacillus antibioticophila]GIO41479.1 hypothetical protein J41TS4_12370 [Paenibacillus apis]